MRPPLSRALPAAEFSAWYWLKRELQDFCSAEGLATSGSKDVLAERVRSTLAGAEAPPVSSGPRRAEPMPARLTPETRVGEGWRLNPALRAFFVAEIGTSFRFNQALRDFIKAPTGRTLADAVAVYRHSVANPTGTIGHQFQFNRHIRDYFAANPQGTRQEALRLWAELRRTRGLLQRTDPEGE